MSVQRVAVVTGANRGIGLATVRALLKQFKGIVYLTSRNQQRGEEAVKALNEEGLCPGFHLLDTSDQQSVQVLKEYLRKKYGGVDILIHNAAVLIKSSDPMSLAEKARVTISTNYFSAVDVCNAILPIMKSEGRVVLLSSQLSLPSLHGCSNHVQSFFKSPNLTQEELHSKMNEYVDAAVADDIKGRGFHRDTYGMSKLGINAFTRILGREARQLDAKNVLVNCCCPGWVKTEMGGPNAIYTVEQGAENPIMLALLPKGSMEPNGEFFQHKNVVRWY